MLRPSKPTAKQRTRKRRRTKTKTSPRRTSALRWLWVLGSGVLGLGFRFRLWVWGFRVQEFLGFGFCLGCGFGILGILGVEGLGFEVLLRVCAVWLQGIALARGRPPVYLDDHRTY